MASSPSACQPNHAVRQQQHRQRRHQHSASQAVGTKQHAMQDIAMCQTSISEKRTRCGALPKRRRVECMHAACMPDAAADQQRNQGQQACTAPMQPNCALKLLIDSRKIHQTQIHSLLPLHTGGDAGSRLNTAKHVALCMEARKHT